MRKKNTRLGMAIGYIAFVVSGVFAVIGAIVDLFGFAQGVSENKESILRFLYTILSYLVIWWKWALGIAVVIVAVNAYIRWAQKKEMEDRQTRNLSWFDAQRRNTKYSGGEEHLYKIKWFLKQKDADFLWWAVTGVAGIGKTRLVIEALRDEKITGADIQWLRSFDDYREDALKERVDTILEKSNLRNIIIAEDAQIYMDNIGVLIGYIAEKPVIELRNHKIRLLLMVRMGEDEELRDRYKQLASKTRQSILQKTRFGEFDKELRMEKYKEEDIVQIVKSYVVNTKKKRRKEKVPGDDQVAEIQTKTIQVLQSEKMDPGHLRPLFAMFIADALLTGKEPMSWDLKSILEYAVIERQEEFLELQSRDLQHNDNYYIFDKIRGIICLAIIRDTLTLLELNDIKENLEERLRYSGIGLKDYLKEMQMMKGDDIVHISMPDILSEYYVLRTLVILPDEEIVKWIIGHLCTSLKGAKATRYKIRQDFKYLYDELEEELDDFYYAFFEECNSCMAYAIIMELLAEGVLRDSNEILFHEAIGNQIRNKANGRMLSLVLYNVICDTPEMEEKRLCLSELERLTRENVGSTDSLLMYCDAIVHLINIAPEMEEKEKYLSELKNLYEENVENEEIILDYCNGLFNIINIIPKMDEKRKYLPELKYLCEENAGNKEIVLVLCKSLSNMIGDTIKIEEKREYLSELKQLYSENKCNIEIVLSYGSGLINMTTELLDMEEMKQCLLELKSLYEENKSNTEIVLEYCEGLFNVIDVAPDMGEKIKSLLELKRLCEENADVVEIIFEYCKGLVNIIDDSTEIEEEREYLLELKHFYRENKSNIEIVLSYSKGLFNVFYDATNIEEKREYLLELEGIHKENASNVEIAYMYCKLLVYMLQYDDDDEYDDHFDEIYKLLSDKDISQYIAKKDTDLIIFIRRDLLDYEYEHGFDDISIILEKVP